MGESKDVDLEAVVKRTQNVLGKYIKKPTLTEKLLRKPPFRFLFDVISVFIRETGCFAGLYTADELNYENIKDREDKMKFLQKMIDATKMTTKSSLSVRPSKIVSGHEPEKTNELLALMGEVMENQLDWQSAVRKITNVGVEEKQEEKTDGQQEVKKAVVRQTSKEKKLKESPIKPQQEKPKVRSSDKEKSGSKVKETKAVKSTSHRKSTVEKDTEKVERKSSVEKVEKIEKETKEKTIRKNKEVREKPKAAKPFQNPPSSPKTEKRVKTVQSSKTKTPSPEVASIREEKSTINEREKLKNDVQQDAPIVTATERRRSSLRAAEVLLAAEVLPNESKPLKSSSKLSHNGKTRESLPSSLDTNESPSKEHEITEKPQTISQPEVPLNTNVKSENVVAKPSKEPVVAKRENTFTRENSQETATRPRTSLRPPSARPASARPGAPRRRDKNVEIVLAPNEPVNMSGINVKLDTFGNFDDDGENLVVIEDPTNSEISSQDNQQDITADSGFDEKQGHLVQQILKTQKELVQENLETKDKTIKERFNSPTVRESSARQINTLRDIIQNLTKSINPLGKLMDFIPEDIDAMHLELSRWRDAFLVAAKELKREQSLTEETTEPLKHQLTQLDESMKEYEEMLNTSRAKILQNAEKIQKLLSGGK